MVQPLPGPFSQVERFLDDLMRAMAQGQYWVVTNRLHPEIVEEHVRRGYDFRTSVSEEIRPLSEYADLVWEIDSIEFNDLKTEAVGVAAFSREGHLKGEVSIALEEYLDYWFITEIDVIPGGSSK